jgi:WD40 repeat protein
MMHGEAHCMMRLLIQRVYARVRGSFYLRRCTMRSAAGGSAIAVFLLSKLGRAPAMQYCVRGHESQATTFALSPFNEHQLVSGSVEGSVMVWRLPENGLTSDLNDPERTLSAAGKMSLVLYHPTVADVLLTVAFAFDGHVIELWDLSAAVTSAKQQPTRTLNLHSEPIIDVDVHPRSHQLVTSCRDGRVRVVHIASARIVHEWTPAESVRTRVYFGSARGACSPSGSVRPVSAACRCTTYPARRPHSFS